MNKLKLRQLVACGTFMGLLGMAPMHVHAGIYTFQANLTGRQVATPTQVPQFDSSGNPVLDGNGFQVILSVFPRNSTASGQATVTLDSDLNTVTTYLTWKNLIGPPDRSHIHSGLFGQSTADVYIPNMGGWFYAWDELFYDTTTTYDSTCFGVPNACPSTTGWAREVVSLGSVDANGDPNYFFGDQGADYSNRTDNYTPQALDYTFPYTPLDLPGILAFFRSGFIFVDIHNESWEAAEIRGQFSEVNAVSEPASLALSLTALGLLGAFRLRRRAPISAPKG